MRWGTSMSGKHITNRQVAHYMSARQAGRTQLQAANAADISKWTGGRLDNAGRCAHAAREYLTRPDAFEAVWSSEVEPLLCQDAQLKAVTLFAELQRRHPGKFKDGQCRTLERRIRQWRAVSGPSRPLMLPQEHPPGWQALIDFTECDQLAVTIDGVALPHRLGHVCCPHSGWEYAQVILGGESYPALAETLRLAFAALGGVPRTLRTDSLSAAYKNLRQQEDLTVRFAALCLHYGCSPTRNNLGIAHENGAVESPNGHLKDRLDQALRLRGNRDFASLADYRVFVAVAVASANAPRAAALEVERSALTPLPRTSAVTWNESLGTVSKFGFIHVLTHSYMVPSRLMGHRLVVRVYDDHLDFFSGQQHVHSCPRLHGPSKRCQTNYHLCVSSLIQKPGAFARLKYRDDLHPNQIYARTWERLRERLSEYVACRVYVRLLHLAHQHNCEMALGIRLAELLAMDALPDAEELRVAFATPAPASVPLLNFHTADPAGYDALRCLPLQHQPQAATL